MKPWTPEVEVTIEAAKSLIAMQFPELLPLEIKYQDSGWDNVVYRVNQKWYFRFPQRKIAVDGVIREMQCLPRIQKTIELAPIVQFQGKPSQDYPYPFFGYEPLTGQEACEVELTTKDRHAMATSLGEILAKLHSKELFNDLKEALPVDPLNRLDFSFRGPLTETRLKELEQAKIDLPYESLRTILNASLSTPRLEANAVVHGDLHFRHLIISPRGQFAGLIDWGDVHLNNAAIDLQLYWSFLPPTSRPAFQKAYGEISEVQFIQARSFAVFVNIALLHYALDIQKPSIQKEALFALKNLLID